MSFLEENPDIIVTSLESSNFTKQVVLGDKLILENRLCEVVLVSETELWLKPVRDYGKSALPRIARRLALLENLPKTAEISAFERVPERHDYWNTNSKNRWRK